MVDGLAAGSAEVILEDMEMYTSVGQVAKYVRVE